MDIKSDIMDIHGIYSYLLLGDNGKIMVIRTNTFSHTFFGVITFSHTF